MPYTDKTLTCRDCGQAFTFTSGEQEFHASRGFTNEPGRCPECRAARKNDRGQGGGGSRGGYDSGYSRGGGGGGYDRPQREMFTVTCAQCGKPAQVPFQPTSDRPVYCSDCFSERRDRDSGQRSRGGRW